jgi:DNA-binding response OmpR family regulator
MGHHVIECFDGVGAITAQRFQRVDAMILDHEMPAGAGRTIAAQIRTETDAPIIFLSGHDREEFREIVTELPDIYYLPKPPDMKRLGELLAVTLPAPAAV